MRKLYKYFLILLLVVPFYVFANDTTYEKGVQSVDTYLNKLADEKDYKRFIDTSITNQIYYLSSNKGTFTKDNFTAKGGFLSSFEYNITKINGNTYLSPGYQYWLYREGKNYYVNEGFELKGPLAEAVALTKEYGVRVTEYTHYNVYASGKGSSGSPWEFKDGSVVSMGVNNYTYGTIKIYDYSTKKTIENKIIEQIYDGMYTKSNPLAFTLTPSTGYMVEDGILKGTNCSAYNGSSANMSLEYDSTLKAKVLKIYNIKGDVKCLVKFKPLVVKVDLNKNNGTSNGNIYLKYNDGWYKEDTGVTVISKVEVPVKTGYTFNGYYYNGNQMTYADGVFTANAKTNLYNTDGNYTWEARYTAHKTRLTYDPTTAHAAVDIAYDAGLPGINKPTKSGYNFKGFYEKPNCEGTRYYTETGATDSKWNQDVSTSTIYACWNEMKFDLTLYHNDGTSNFSTIEVSYGLPMNNATVLTSTEHNFGGYFYTAEKPEVQYFDSNGKSLLEKYDKTKKIDLYARWYDYTINYEPEGINASKTNKPTSALHGDNIVVDNPASKPINVTYDANGYTDIKIDGKVGTQVYKGAASETFTGWTVTSSAGSLPEDARNSKTVTDTWDGTILTKSTNFANLGVKDDRVTFVSHWNGTSITTKSVSKVGYTCNWNTRSDGGGETYTAGQKVSLDGETPMDISIYAICTPKTYTVTLNMQDANLANQKVEVSFDKPMPTITIPDNGKNVFGGFYTETNGKGTKYYNGDGTSAHNWDKDNTNVTLYALWYDYLITYDTKNSTTHATAPQSGITNQEITISAPTKKIKFNYDTNGITIDKDKNAKEVSATFTGWKAENVGSGAQYLNGSWKAWEGDVLTTATKFKNLNKNGETVKLVAHYNKIANNKLNEIVKKGFTCKWGTTPGSDGELYDSATIFDIDEDSPSSYTFYAHCSANKYTLTLKSNVSTDEKTTYSGVTSGSTTVKATFGSAMPEITLPTRVGYKFDGYINKDKKKYYNADGTSALTWDTASDTNLYAAWKPNSYNIQYNTSGATSPITTNNTSWPKTGNVDAIVTIQNPEKKITIKYDANGDATKVPGNGSVVQAFKGWTISSSRNADTAVYGTSSNDINTSWVNLNTLVKAMYFKNLSITDGATIKLTAHWENANYVVGTPTKSGHTCYWYKNSSATSEPIIGGSILETTESDPGEIVLYAKCFAQSYNVTFNKVAGNGGTDKTFATYGEKMETIDVPSKYGFDFSGYYDKTDCSGTRFYDENGNNTNVYNKNADSTLYACWKASKYSIQYLLNGGVKGSSQPTSAEYGVTSGIKVDNPSKIITLKVQAQTGVTLSNKGEVTGKPSFQGWTTTIGTGDGMVDATAQYSLNNSSFSTWNGSKIKGSTYTYFRNLRADNKVAILTATWGETNIPVPTMTKKGYTCLAYDNIQLEGKGYAGGTSYTVSEDLVGNNVPMYVNCTPNSYKVNFNSNGAETPGIKSMIVKFDDVFPNLREENGELPTKIGYAFAGYEYKNGTVTYQIYSGKGYNLEGYRLSVDKDITLNANWYPEQYNLKPILGFDRNGKNVYSSDIPVYYKERITGKSAQGNSDVAIEKPSLLDFLEKEPDKVDVNAISQYKKVFEGYILKDKTSDKLWEKLRDHQHILSYNNGIYKITYYDNGLIEKNNSNLIIKNNGKSDYIWEYPESKYLYAVWRDLASNEANVVLLSQETNGGNYNQFKGVVMAAIGKSPQSEAYPAPQRKDGVAFCGYYDSPNGKGNQYYNAKMASVRTIPNGWGGKATPLYAYFSSGCQVAQY